MGKEGRILNPFLKGVILATSAWLGASGREFTDLNPSSSRDDSQYLGVCETVEINNAEKLYCIKDGKQTIFEITK